MKQQRSNHPKMTAGSQLLSQAKGYYHRHQRLALLGIFGITWLVAAFGYYHRFPQNMHYANFFAEDGQHFTANIMHKGFVRGMLTPFNGYFVFGIYILTGIGFVVNAVLHAGQFVDLPASLAIVSYGFLGLCCALPILLLKPYMRLPYRLAAGLIMLLLPMPSFDYTTIGTIGNLKFAFTYIAVLLALYRIKLPRGSKRIIGIDLALLLAIFTTAGAYIVLPFLFLGDGLRLKQLRDRKHWRELLSRQNVALWSFVALGLVACVQIAYVGVHGVPKLAGYLDQPYEWHKTVEVFLARCYLYPFIAAAYHHLSDTITVLLFAAGIVLIALYGNLRNRWAYCLAIVSIFAMTLVFIAARTGVTVYYNHYQTSGFDNFFYAQNFIAIVIGMLLLSDIGKRFSWFRTGRLAVAICLLIVVGELYVNRSYAPSDFMQYQIGTLKQQAQAACAQKGNGPITFMVYPFSFLTMTEARSVLCTKDTTHAAMSLDGYGLMTNDNTALNIGPMDSRFTQTFVSHGRTLHGLAVYLSTYYASRLPGYHLFLMDASCKNVIVNVPLPVKVRDNAYRTITLPAQHDALGKHYCFSVTPDNAQSPPLAMQLSQVDYNPDVMLKIDGAPTDRDIVFQAIY